MKRTVADFGDVVDHAGEIGRRGGSKPRALALGEEDEGEQAEDGGGSGEAGDVGGAAAGGLRSSSPALRSMMTKTKRTMMAPE